MRQFFNSWADPISWLCHHFLAMFIPIFFSFVLTLGIKHNFELTSITDGGQFALSSVALLVSTNYVLTKQSSRRLAFTQGFGLLILLLFALSLLLFCLAILFQNGQDIDDRFLVWPTIIIFIIVFGIAFVAK